MIFYFSAYYLVALKMAVQSGSGAFSASGGCYGRVRIYKKNFARAVFIFNGVGAVSGFEVLRQSIRLKSKKWLLEFDLFPIESSKKVC